MVAVKELEEKEFVDITVTQRKAGRFIIGFILTIRKMSYNEMSNISALQSTVPDEGLTEEEKKAREIKEKLYEDLIIDVSISRDRSPKFIAREMMKNKEIEFIPPKFN